MSGYAGCFYDSRARVEAMVDRIQSGSAAGACPEPCPAGGYVGMVMRVINATWPHSGHVFLNLGHPGAAPSDPPQRRPPAKHVQHPHGCVPLIVPNSIGIISFPNDPLPSRISWRKSHALTALFCLVVGPVAGSLLHSLANHWCSEGLLPKKTQARARACQGTSSIDAAAATSAAPSAATYTRACMH